MSKDLFDIDGFYAVLDAERSTRKLNWKQVAEQAGVSASTFTRMSQGKKPDVDTLASLARWARISVDQFVGSFEPKMQIDTLTQITAYLRCDPCLSPEGAEALEAVLKAGYEKLRIN